MQAPFEATRRLAERRGRRRAIISLTPLIDVVFILLVFFMLASSFMEWRTVSLDTAAAGQPTPSEQQPFVVRISADAMELEGELITRDELIATARDRQPVDQAVSLQPMAGISVQRLVEVLDDLNAAGIAPLKLVDDPQWQPDEAPPEGPEAPD